MEATLTNIINRTPKENMSIAKFMIIDYLNRNQIDYGVFTRLEKLIEKQWAN